MSKVTFVVVLLLLVGFACSSKKAEKAESTVKQVNEYPDIELTLRDGGKLSTKTLEGNNVFVFFQPDCEHCQVEAVHIEQRLQDFKDYKLYFISSSSMDAINGFAESFDLDDRENVTFAWASTESVLDHYGPIQTPSVYIYSHGKLKRYFNGQTEIESIVNSL